MAKLTTTIQTRTYRLNCDDGDEARLHELASYVRVKADQLVAEHGRIADDTLLLMSAILIADELFDERAVRVRQAELEAEPEPDSQARAS